jgi:hypothetical protein
MLVDFETDTLAKQEQRLAALQIGNQSRYARADFKRELKTLSRAEGVAKIAELIADPPKFADSWKIGEPLRAVPRLHKAKIARALNLSACSELRTIGALSERQRQTLVGELTKLSADLQVKA